MIITDKEAIKKAIGGNIPDSLLPKELIPFGYFKFKGLRKSAISLNYNKSFTVGKTYCLFEYDNNVFVVTNNGEGRKYYSNAFTKIK